MANATEERLWSWVEKFSNYFTANQYQELLKVEASLQDPSLPENRKRALVFSMYQLMVYGAISEHNIEEYQSVFPEFVHDQLQDSCLELAATKAWKGSAYTPARSNILGSIAFMVVMLFFFESACQMRLNDYDSGFGKLLEKLEEQGCIGSEDLKALKYLAEFRNAWHNFGFYKKDKAKECSYEPVSGALTFPALKPGDVIKPLYEPQALHLFDRLLTTFCKLTGVSTATTASPAIVP